MKKILAVVVAALMIFQSFGVLAAPDATFGPIEVVTDIDLVAKTNDGKVDVVEIESGDKIDFEASINMQNVRDEFKAILNTLNDSIVADDVKTKNVALSGEFTLVLAYDSAIKLSNSVVKGKNLAGFNSEASKVFYEVKRTVSIGKEISTLTIEIGVREGVTVGAISDNLKKYLCDMKFTGSTEAISTVGEFTIAGELAGSVYGYAEDSDGFEYEGIVTFTAEETPVIDVVVLANTYAVTAEIAGITDADDVTATFAGEAVEIVDGVIEVEDVLPGLYNLVVVKNGVSKVTVVEVKDSDVTVAVEFPAKNIGFDIIIGAVDAIIGSNDVADDIFDTIKDTAIEGVGTVDEIVEAEGKVVIETTVDEFVVEPELEAEIKGDNENVIVEGVAGVVTEAKIYEAESEEPSEIITVVESPIHIVVSFPTFGKENIEIYAQVGEEVVALEDFVVDTVNSLIHIYTDNATANFAIAYTEIEDEITESTDDDEYEEEQGGSSGGSSGGRLPGNHSTKPNGSFAGDTAIVALYNDVNEAHWAYAYIEKMAREGIMNGTGNYQFEPEAPLTRAAVVKMLASLVKAEVAQSSLTFYDVPQSEWYNPYVAWGVANGIVTGYSDTEFAPDKAITRQELAAMIVRFLGKYNIFCPVTTAKATFADDAAIEPYAYDAVYTLQMAGILNGKGDNMFAPADNTTRAEAAKVFSFIVDLYK